MSFHLVPHLPRWNQTNVSDVSDKQTDSTVIYVYIREIHGESNMWSIIQRLKKFYGLDADIGFE